MEEKTTKKKVENLPPNYRTLAQLQEQWEKKRAQELKRNQQQEKEEEEPAPETVFLGDGGGGDTCPEVKATGEGEGVETKKNRSRKSKKRKGKGKNEGEVKPREVKKEKSDVESAGEGNPRGERKGGGFKGNRAVEKWVKVGSVGVGESDRTVGKELEIENVVVESDRKVMAGRVGELSVKRRRGRGPRMMGNRRDWTAKSEGLEVENVGVDESDRCLGAVKENVGVDESNFAVEVGRELGELSVGDVRKNSQRGYNSGGNRAKWKNGRVGRGSGVGTHRDKTGKVEGFETENVGIEGNDQTLDAENVGVEESDQKAGIGRKLVELSVREDGESSGHRGRNGGRYGTKGQNIRGGKGRGRGGMGHHGDRMLKGLEIENVEAERSDQKVENVVEIKGADGKNVGMEKSACKAEVGLSVRDDEGREDARSYRHRDHNGGGNMTKWKKGSQGRGRCEMSYHRDQMVKVEKELDMENLGVEDSDHTVSNMVEIRDVTEENLGVECDQTLDNVLEIKDAVEENVGVESGGTAEVGYWQHERAGRGGGGGRTENRRGRDRGGYSNGNDKWGNGRGNQWRGRERNGTVWVRKEDSAARSKDIFTGEGVKRSVGILS